jgi:hypothetical protein
MKKYFLIIATLFYLNAGAQQKFDIVSYNLPANWVATQLSPALTIQKKSDTKNNCKILIYPSTAGSITNENDFKAHWEKGAGNIYGKLPDPLKLDIQDGGDWKLYAASSSLTLNSVQVTRQFISITNKNLVINIIVIITDKSCRVDIDDIIGSFAFSVEKNGEGIIRGKAPLKARRVPKFHTGKEI